MNQPGHKKYSGAIWAALAVGIALRMFAATLGYSADVAAFMFHVDLMEHGKNVYANINSFEKGDFGYGYNYGPVWFNICYVLHQLAFRDNVVFRYLLAAFLTLVDIGIFVLLKRRFGSTPALLFFLNPISILITGFHSQFDNLAIYLALLSTTFWPENKPDEKLGRQHYRSLFLLGLSLATKHLFFVFPFWLALKERGLIRKANMIVVPIGIFLLSFAPYWKEGGQGIIYNVFLYKSISNQYFYRFFVPPLLQHFLSAKTIWLLCLGLFGIIAKSRNRFESALLYTCVLVTFSPAIVNQYLAITVPFLAVYPNIFFMLYSLIGMIHLLIDPCGLHLSALQFLEKNNPVFALKTGASTASYYSFLVILLFFGLIWHFRKKEILSCLSSFTMEVKRFFECKND